MICSIRAGAIMRPKEGGGFFFAETSPRINCGSNLEELREQCRADI
jgi:hypothetical protein